MQEHREPRPISTAEHRARSRRITRIGRRLGFTGRIEYRHAYSRSGGAQYCIGPAANDDIMILYAEAFERDADPADFTLEAIIAHECGHQRLIRSRNLRAVLAKFPGDKMEEVLASLVGSILLGESESWQPLVWKAAAELCQLGVHNDAAMRFTKRLRHILGDCL
jgi:hypothetical protein